MGFLFPVLIITGCSPSLSSLQSGRTLEAGTSRHSLAVGARSTHYDSIIERRTDPERSGDGDTPENSNRTPQMEYGYYYGVSDSFDIGLKFRVISATVESKYNLVSSEKFAVSSGLSIGFDYLCQDCAKGIEYSLPVYMSYDFTPTLNLYLTPRAVYRINHENFSLRKDRLLGVAAGFSTGFDPVLLVEASYYQSLVDGSINTEEVLVGLGFGNSREVGRSGQGEPSLHQVNAVPQVGATVGDMPGAGIVLKYSDSKESAYALNLMYGLGLFEANDCCYDKGESSALFSLERVLFFHRLHFVHLGLARRERSKKKMVDFEFYRLLSYSHGVELGFGSQWGRTGITWLSYYHPISVLPHASKVTRLPKGPWEDVEDFGELKKTYEQSPSWQFLRFYVEMG